MDLEKLKSFKGVSAQRLLNAFNNNEITREEYRLLRRLEKENAWDQIEQLTTTQPEPAPVKSASANFAPAEFAPPTTESLPDKPTIKSVQSDKLQLLDKISISKKFYKVPNEVMDKIPVHLTMAEEVVYHHMVRLSYGWGRNYCRVGYGYFLKKSSIKARATVVEAIKGLVEKGMIIPHKSDNGKVDSNNEGTLYIVCIPSYGDQEESGIPNISIPENSIPSYGIPNNSIPENSIPNSDIPSQTSITASNSEGILNSGIPINEHYKYNKEFKYTLSKDRANQYINSFYASLGQARISKKERERAIEVYDSLKKEGFTEEEISFAVEWTINNVKDARSFAILEHTIGQALSEREKILEQQALEDEMEKERQAELEKRRLEEEENAKLDEYISNLSPAERKALESQARDELIRKEQIGERYINSMVLGAKVKEIVKKERF